MPKSVRIIRTARGRNERGATMRRNVETTSMDIHFAAHGALVGSTLFDMVAAGPHEQSPMEKQCEKDKR